MEIKVSGLKEIEAQLNALGSKTGTKILRQSMLAAARPIVEQAKSNVASIEGGSGALHKSMGSRFYAGSKPVFDESGLPVMGGNFKVEIAPIKRNRTAIALHNLVYGRRRKGIFYGHLIEFGHRIVTRGKKEIRGNVPPRPFLGPALQVKGQSAVSILTEQLKARIARQIEKNRK